MASITPDSVLVRLIPSMLRGGWAALTMVTLIESETEPVPSSAVSVRVTVELDPTQGAVNVVAWEVELANSIARAESWPHEYVKALPSWSEAVPVRATVEPSKTVWSGPAFTDGRVFAETSRTADVWTV